MTILNVDFNNYNSWSDMQADGWTMKVDPQYGESYDDGNRVNLDFSGPGLKVTPVATTSYGTDIAVQFCKALPAKFQGGLVQMKGVRSYYNDPSSYTYTTMNTYLYISTTNVNVYSGNSIGPGWITWNNFGGHGGEITLNWFYHQARFGVNSSNTKIGITPIADVENYYANNKLWGAVNGNYTSVEDYTIPIGNFNYIILWMYGYTFRTGTQAYWLIDQINVQYGPSSPSFPTSIVGNLDSTRTEFTR